MNFKYRKKPVVIEAVKFDPAVLTCVQVGDATVEAVPQWLRDAVAQGVIFHDSNGWRCRTLEGTSYTLTDGYWILQGVKGEIYPCAGDIFESTYEPEPE